MAGTTTRAVVILEAIDRMTSGINRAVTASARRLDSFGRTAEGFGRQAVMGAVAIGAPLVLSTKAAMDFESSFAGVKKTVTATDSELATLQKTLLKMSSEIPVNVNQLNDTAAAAGQLGIQTKNLAGFVRVMSDLKVSTNLGDEGPATLAKFANITKMAQTDFDRLGSTIVALGNNMATTEQDITNFGMRIAGAGAQVGISQDKIMGIGAALSSVGLEAEAGGTAMSKLLIDIAQASGKGGKQLDQMAKVAGMSSAKFAEAFKTDAAGATVTFIEGLGKIKESGGSVFETLEKLGYTEVRLRDSLLRASGAGGLLRKSLDLSSTAWKENNALTKEAAARYATNESKMLMFKNKLQNLAITAGNVLLPVMSRMMDIFSGIFEWISDLNERFPVLSKVIIILTAALSGFLAVAGVTGIVVGNVAKGLSAMAKITGWLTRATITNTASRIANTVANTAGYAAIAAITVAKKSAAAAQWLWNVAITANPIGIIIVAVGALVAAIALMITNFEKAKKIISLIAIPIKMFFWPMIAIAKIFGVKMADIPKAIEGAWKGLKGFFSGIFNSIKDSFTSAWEFVKSLPGRMFDAGKRIIESIGEGMKSVIMAPVNFVKDMAGKIASYLPFSPAKKGPLKNIMKVRIVESIAETMKPAPAVDAMRRVTEKVSQEMEPNRGGILGRIGGAVSDLFFPRQQSGGGGISVTISPTINISGATEGGTTESIMKELQKFGPAIARIVQNELAKKERTSFTAG